MNLALFDFDGTITFKDTFSGFIYDAVDLKRTVLGSIILSPYIIGYSLGFVSDSVIRSHLCRFGFKGKSEIDIEEAGLQYSRRSLNQVIRKNALEQIAWHKEQGDQIVVVSSSLNVYLADWCQQMDVDLICNHLESKDGVLTGLLVGGDCGGQEKARRILEKYSLQQYSTIYAYGDTSNDHAMLALANKKYFRWQELQA